MYINFNVIISIDRPVDTYHPHDGCRYSVKWFPALLADDSVAVCVQGWVSQEAVESSLLGAGALMAGVDVASRRLDIRGTGTLPSCR